MTIPTIPAIPPPPVEPEPAIDFASMLVAQWARDALLTVGNSNPRSHQAKVGPSEIGGTCARRLAHRALRTAPVNVPEPLAAMFGTGMHLLMAERMALGDAGTGRYLLEVPVAYREIEGSVDLFDRFNGRLVDWKTSSKRTIGDYRRGGALPMGYKVQTAIYAEGLRAAGHDVASTALVFVPRDGTLADTWAWVAPPDKDLADQYIDRWLAIKAKAMAEGAAALEPSPSPLCKWCPNHQARAVDLTVACPGKDHA